MGVVARAAKGGGVKEKRKEWVVCGVNGRGVSLKRTVQKKACSGLVWGVFWCGVGVGVGGLEGDHPMGGERFGVVSGGVHRRGAGWCCADVGFVLPEKGLWVGGGGRRVWGGGLVCGLVESVGRGAGRDMGRGRSRGGTEAPSRRRACEKVVVARGCRRGGKKKAAEE